MRIAPMCARPWVARVPTVAQGFGFTFVHTREKRPKFSHTILPGRAVARCAAAEAERTWQSSVTSGAAPESLSSRKLLLQDGAHGTVIVALHPLNFRALTQPFFL